jgi:hypothetical protein
VDVKNGGTFHYDLVDVSRFAKRMYEDRDSRTFTVKPVNMRIWILRHRLEEWWDWFRGIRPRSGPA